MFLGKVGMASKSYPHIVYLYIQNIINNSSLIIQ